MSTRSLVGLTENGETIEYIYIHCDGYPDGVGLTLQTHYITSEQIKALLAMGDALGLAESVRASAFFARDRGEDLADVAARHCSTNAWESAAYDRGAEYAYLFDARAGQWQMTEIR
jgi:hypothetical protein